MVELRLIHVPIDELLLLDTVIVVSNNCDEEVEHANIHEEDLGGPEDPKEKDVNGLEDARLSLQEPRVDWCRQLTDCGVKCLQHHLGKVADALGIQLSDLRAENCVTDGVDEQENDKEGRERHYGD